MEETIITSVQNARIKHVVALQQKSSLRREEGLFVVEGQREIEHCIACGYEIQELFVLDSLKYTGSITPTLVSHQVYEKMAYRESTEGIIAIAKAKDHSLATLNASLFTPNAERREARQSGCHPAHSRGCGSGRRYRVRPVDGSL